MTNVWLSTLRKLPIEKLKLGLFVVKRENDLLVDREAFKCLRGTFGKEAIIWGSLYWQEGEIRQMTTGKYWQWGHESVAAKKTVVLPIDRLLLLQPAVHTMNGQD